MLELVPENERAKDIRYLDMSCEKLPVEKALGVVWDVETDSIGFQTVVNHKPPTRRGILSILSSIYDPLGLLSPYVVCAKIIVQELCRRHVGWDDPVPPDILN